VKDVAVQARSCQANGAHKLRHPAEIETALFDEKTGLAARIGRDIGAYTVGLLSVTGSGPNEVLDFQGSGTLVSVYETLYVLTAAHVWEKFENAAGIGLTLDEEDEDHRFFIDVRQIVPLGPKESSSWGPQGLDLLFLKIPPSRAAELREVKKAYPLTVEIPEPPQVNSLEVWVLLGSPREQNKITAKHASLTINGFFAKIRSEYTLGNHDYFELEMNSTFPGIPRRFYGVSGGGFWSVVMYWSEGGEVQWFLTLVGMACWQIPVSSEPQIIRCLGAKSIRTFVPQLS
jgi:hypothetical protein